MPRVAGNQELAVAVQTGMRLRLVGIVLIGMASVLAATGCAAAESLAGPTSENSWRELPDSPLSPRIATVGLWTGREVLLIGGIDSDLCPPNADCAQASTGLVDGAAVDPRTGSWRRIADAPVPIASAQAVVVGQTGYFLLPRIEPESGAELVAYEVDQDQWRRVPLPFESGEWYQLAVAGDQLVAYLGSDEVVTGEDYVFDPEAETWRPLPPDPLGEAFDRTMVWTGEELVLFGKDRGPEPEGKPTVVRAAALDLAGASWRQLPDSEILSAAPWLATDGTLVNPTLGGADGGETNNWGRTYPYGGRLALRSERWSPLPEPPDGVEYAAGAFAGSTALYVGDQGAVLDLATDRWVPIPVLPDADFASRTVVAAGRDLLVFGGVSWASATDPELSDRTWIWSPRPA